LKILVTGAAGFIGYHLTQSLIQSGKDVVGLDNINAYYDLDLKWGRLSELGITAKDLDDYGKMAVGTREGFTMVRMNLEDREALPRLFKQQNFDVVVSLAAQAGVRYSLESPETYVDSNLSGHSNLLECCRHHGVKHLIYASSSSVYGLNTNIPFKETDCTESPASIYAATKKSNEVMAHAYSHLFSLPTTGLRFFTVYGPWGRPDMAPILFTEAILKGEPIKIFNQGDMERDFTYVADIVSGILAVVGEDVTTRIENHDFYKVYNIGKGAPVRLMDFIETLEEALGKKAIKKYYPMQPGDVQRTWADTTALETDYGYRPETDLTTGIRSFVDWYLQYYQPN
jgi:UDP-glucuronate 4-epimerase